jgi:hypothetical protein
MIDWAIDRHVEQFIAAIDYSLASFRRSVATVAFAVATYLVLILSTFPVYSVQLLGADPAYLDEAVLALTANTYATTGPHGLGLVVTYAVVTAVAVTNVLGRVRQAGLTGASGLSSALPGLLASGCASCGAGVLGVLGFAGALATLPFEGNLLRLGGLLLVVGYLARAGDPRQCRIASGSGGK